MARSRRRRVGRGLAETTMPSLNSLMDVVTIILVYFVKTFAVSPITVQDPSVQLPISTSRENPEEAIVVMITGAERRTIGPQGEKLLVPDIPTISVDSDLVLQLGSNFEVSPSEVERQFVISKLKQKLLEVRKLQGVTAELTEQGGLSGDIVLVVDKQVPFKLLSMALVTAAEAGYPGFKFAIVKHED
ncbi:MAG TPA: biopolymer transporter ExbD [Myxococcota bacterium]|nr:biopolymer transporter ExbD [Myxococcota bacterium]